ncbi:MAG: hypothetical protein LW630_11860 [Saprospiraceae bacterium]|jgi:16S rRNA processing protein RimM|nr:hypothetical protein [Saprospiraceae bacterium]
MQSSYSKIGIVQKPVGRDGALKIDVQDDFFDDFIASDHLFIKMNGAFVPWFIEEKWETNYLMVKFEEVDSPEDAAKFTLRDIFLRTSDIHSDSFLQKKESFGWVGFSILQDGKVIGTISEIVEYPSQLMAIVPLKGKQILIPLNEAFIEKIDSSRKYLYMNLPDGLLGL